MKTCFDKASYSLFLGELSMMMESSLNLRESKESSLTLRELSKSPKAHGPHSEDEGEEEAGEEEEKEPNDLREVVDLELV